MILYDSDWNPQVDLQAIGRVHRIGQKKPCHIYRLITEGTVEERIYDRAQKKLYLSEMVNRDEAGPVQQQDRLGKRELVNMLTVGADSIFNSAGRLPTSEELDAMIDRTDGATWTQKPDTTDTGTDTNTDTSSSLSSVPTSLPPSALPKSLSSGFNQSGSMGEIDFSIAGKLSEYKGVVYDRTRVVQVYE